MEVSMITDSKGQVLKCGPGLLKAVLVLILTIIIVPAVAGPSRASDMSAGQSSYFNGNYEDALKHFNKALRKRPDDAMLHYFIGRTCFHLGRFKKARTSLEDAVELKPDYDLARLQLARACYELKDFECAIEQFLYLKEERSSELEKPDFAMMQAAVQKKQSIDEAKAETVAKKTGVKGGKDVDLTPPVIIITSPKGIKNGMVVRKSTGVFIEGYVKDDSPMKTLEINGESISIDDHGKFSKSLFLSIGNNPIKIVATDIYFNKVTESFTVSKKLEDLRNVSEDLFGKHKRGSGFSQHYGVIIGIGEYKDKKIPGLDFTVADAQGIYDVLTSPEFGFFKKENLKLLLNEKATTRNIRYALENWLPEHAVENDVVLIYYAGHGAPENESTYWVTYDADIDDLYDTALSNDELSKMLKKIKSKTVISFLDSCYSAATINRNWHARGLRFKEDPFKKFKGTGKVVITSSDGRQESLELEKFGHGVFSHFLITGLEGSADRNNDGFIVLDEVWDFVKHNVSETSRKFGLHQTPVIDGRHSTGIVLSRYPNKP